MARFSDKVVLITGALGGIGAATVQWIAKGGARRALTDINKAAADVPAAITAQVCERYRAIGGRSPLLEITRRQARSLQDHLKRLGRSAEVFVGMRHWHPFIPANKVESTPISEY